MHTKVRIMTKYLIRSSRLIRKGHGWMERIGEFPKNPSPNELLYPPCCGNLNIEYRSQEPFGDILLFFVVTPESLTRGRGQLFSKRGGK
jgi:hypothetical protein